MIDINFDTSEIEIIISLEQFYNNIDRENDGDIGSDASILKALLKACTENLGTDRQKPAMESQFREGFDKNGNGHKREKLSRFKKCNKAKESEV